MHFFAKASVFVATAAILLAVAPARSAPPCPLIPSPLADGIPDDVCPNPPPTPQKAFAHMAWQTFKSLVWPALMVTGSRGEPDGAREITEMSGPRVFETYKSDWELFPVIAAGQEKWGTYPSAAAFCKDYVPPKPGRLPVGSLVLGSLDKFGSLTQPGGLGHVLMAQNGSLVRYLAAFNENAFNLIKNLGPSIDFDASEDEPKGQAIAPYGTITIKSAWIEIKNSIPDPSTFYVRPAWVQDPSTGNCKETSVALVGLHIVHKTDSSRQWIWASFEHVKNAPLRGDSPRGAFTFHNGSRIPMPADPPLDSRTMPSTMPAPYNVERLNEIAPEIQPVNLAWQNALQGSVWSNYQLVLVQWPEVSHAEFDGGTTLFGNNGVRPAPPCGVVRPRANMASTVMETFLQSTEGLDCPTDDAKLRNTCMGCHYQAHNYDFIWAIPLKRGTGDARVETPNRGSALSTLRKITGWNSR